MDKLLVNPDDLRRGDRILAHTYRYISSVIKEYVVVDKKETLIHLKECDSSYPDNEWYLKKTLKIFEVLNRKVKPDKNYKDVLKTIPIENLKVGDTITYGYFHCSHIYTNKNVENIGKTSIKIDGDWIKIEDVLVYDIETRDDKHTDRFEICPFMSTKENQVECTVFCRLNKGGDCTFLEISRNISTIESNTDEDDD
jgi:hypothetical protein